jgi:hypothetical protein
LGYRNSEEQDVLDDNEMFEPLNKFVKSEESAFKVYQSRLERLNKMGVKQMKSKKEI